MSKDARYNPVVKSGREINTADLELGQSTSVNLDVPRETEHIEPVDIALEIDKKYLEALKFNEDPITIMITKSPQKYAPKIVDCWVNGKGAEQFRNGKWMTCGWLPIGVEVTTRRKYVEALIRAKHDSIETETIKREEYEDNFAHRATQAVYPISVMSDPSPEGYAWLTKIMRER